MNNFPLSYPDALHNCALCPRQCHADRVAGPLGYCRTGAGWSIASICVHRGEEPAISGPRGICNIFFAHCNLQCRFCQNHQISRNPTPEAEFAISRDQALDRIGRLLDTGCSAVGFVSPSHVLPQMVSLMEGLSDRGRHPTYVYNTNGYDQREVLAALEGRVQVYLPDLKYLDSGLAEKWSDAPDYPEVAARALQEMYRQTGPKLELDAEGAARSGLIVRHLVLPGEVGNSKRVLRFIADELSPEVHVSLMAQYLPTPDVAGDPLLGRGVSREEYAEVVAELDRLGLENGWVQELNSRGHYVPDFDRTHPFGR